MSSDVPYHAFDRASRDALRHWVVDVVEGLLGRRLAPGAQALQTRIERGSLDVDGLATGDDGTPIHIEIQTSAKSDMNFRMAQYFTALDSPDRPPPEQHLILLWSKGDRADLGEHHRGDLHLRYQVHRLWQIDPEVLRSRPGLLRFAPLAQASDEGERVELLRHATQGIRAHFAGYEEHDNLMWMRRLASLYLPDPLIVQTLEVMQVPIDLSDIPMIRDALAEGRAEGRASGHAEGRAEGEDRARRDDIGRVVRTRFADEELAGRAASIPQNLLEDTLDRAVTAATSEELAAWLQTHNA